MGVNFIDQFSLLHFAVGIVVYFWNISLLNWIIIHTIFELTENTEFGMKIINTVFKNIWPGGKNYADKPINIIGDSVFSILGWLFARTVDYQGNKLGLYSLHIQ